MACAERNSVYPEIGDEQADEQAIRKPQTEERRHGGRSARINGQKPHRSLLVFFLHGGRVHVLMGTKREMIEPRSQASRAHGAKKLLFLGELAVIALVILQHHVNEGTSHEDDDSSEQDREQ